MTMATSIAVMNKGRIEQMGSPMEIYRQPASRFVANFVGSPPMNMLSAGEAPGFATEAARTLGMEGRVIEVIGIRPEAVRLTADMSATSLRARIDTIQPTGADWIVGLVSEGRQLFALAAEEPPAGIGDDVGIILRQDGLHAFDKDGKNLTRTS
jgi:ABC-type sugar transport system ATPase subunit